MALVVRAEPGDLELLVIERATRDGDPWSGHMAFPGGRMSLSDDSPRATAERETREEVGIDLARSGRLLGPLAPVAPRPGGPPILIWPFVFAVPAATGTTLNHEVAATFWIPLRELSSPGAVIEYHHPLQSGEALRFPAIAYENRVIWGLTHRIMAEFLDVLRAAVAAGEGS